MKYSKKYLEYLLEHGKTPDGRMVTKEMLIAMQDVAGYDPWIDEPWTDEELKALNEAEPCDHPGCMSHVSHPCEGCGKKWGNL